MRIAQVEIDTNSASTQRQQYGFRQGGVHKVRRLYILRPKEGERFYLWKLLLLFQGAKNFALIRRVNSVQCHSARELIGVKSIGR